MQKTGIFARAAETIRGWWLGLSDSTREHLVSMARVFVATFIVTAAGIISAAGMGHFSGALLASAVTAGVNAAVSAILKVLIQLYAPPSLGGRR